MPHLPPAHHETSKHDSPNETKIKEKQNKTILDLNLNLTKSMTHHNQTKELTTWFLMCKPKELGELVIHDLNHFGRALHQKWCWYHCTDDERPWIGYATPCNEEDIALFQASTTIKLGNREKAVF
jgi:hypothetical protein